MSNHAAISIATEVFKIKHKTKPTNKNKQYEQRIKHCHLHNKTIDNNNNTEGLLSKCKQYL